MDVIKFKDKDGRLRFVLEEDDVEPKEVQPEQTEKEGKDDPGALPVERRRL